MANERRNFMNVAEYERLVDAVSAPGALSLEKMTSTLAVDGTDAFTLAAPRWRGQRKIITQITGANTPNGTVTITGMRVASQNAWNFNNTTAQLETDPQVLTLYSPDGVVWDVVSAVGVTVA